MVGKYHIHCLGEQRIDSFECDHPYFVITINESLPAIRTSNLLENAIKWNAKNNCFSVCDLVFDDIEQDSLPVSGTKFAVGIYKEQAETIANFVKFALDQKIDVFVCQCQAGVSRSAAVASALALLLNGDKDAYEHWEVMPNQRVFKMVLASLMERVEVLVGA